MAILRCHSTAVCPVRRLVAARLQQPVKLDQVDALQVNQAGGEPAGRRIAHPPQPTPARSSQAKQPRRDETSDGALIRERGIRCRQQLRPVLIVFKDSPSDVFDSLDPVKQAANGFSSTAMVTADPPPPCAVDHAGGRSGQPVSQDGSPPGAYAGAGHDDTGLLPRDP